MLNCLINTVDQVKWCSLRDAVLWCFTSINNVIFPINEYQRSQFVTLGIKRCDLMMMITMVEGKKNTRDLSITGMYKH